MTLFRHSDWIRILKVLVAKLVGSYFGSCFCFIKIIFKILGSSWSSLKNIWNIGYGSLGFA